MKKAECKCREQSDKKIPPVAASGMQTINKYKKEPQIDMLEFMNNHLKIPRYITQKENQFCQYIFEKYSGSQ